MTPRAALAALAVLGGALAACGSPAPPPAPPAPPRPVAAIPAAVPPAPGATPAPATLVPPAPAGPAVSVPTYDAKGRRDPFELLRTTEGPTGLQVSSTRLTGIVHGAQTLALLETSDGLGYILKPGDTLGDGRLLEIGADTVVFAIAAKPGSSSTRVVLKLAAN